MMELDIFYDCLLSDNPKDKIIQNEEYFFSILPELRLCKGLNQKNKWHIYDVYEHILHVIDGVDKNIYLRIAALFHDIGKPKSMVIDENGIGHFPKHYDISNEIFLSFAKKYNLDKKTIDLVSKLIVYHDKNLTKLDSISDIFTKEELEMLYCLKRSDLMAQSNEFHYLIDSYYEEEKRLIKNYY